MSKPFYYSRQSMFSYIQGYNQVSAIRSATFVVCYKICLEADGINDAWIQRRLLAEQAQTFEKPLQLVKLLKSVEKDTWDLQKLPPFIVYQVPSATSHCSSTSANHTTLCYQCGRANFTAKCCFMDTECHSCKKKDLLARMHNSNPFKPVKKFFKELKKQPLFKKESRVRWGEWRFLCIIPSAFRITQFVYQWIHWLQLSDWLLCSFNALKFPDRLEVFNTC